MAVLGTGFTATVTSKIFLAGMLNMKIRYHKEEYVVVFNSLPIIFLIHAILKIMKPNVLLKTVADTKIWKQLKNQSYFQELPSNTFNFLKLKSMNKYIIVKYTFIIVSIIIIIY